jgi:hypothetical protein
MPHLAAKLAAAGRIRAVVVRHQKFSGAKTAARSVQRLIRAWGMLTLARFAIARLMAMASDRLFPHRYYSIEKVAREFGLPIYYVNKIHSDEFYGLLSAQPDPLVFSQVSARLKPELLGRAVFVNKHCGLLPAYAGVYPVFWALLNREDRLGVTVHVMAEEYDAGELLAQTSVAAQGHSVSSAYHALYDRAADLLLRLFSSSTPAIPQEGARSYFSWPSSADRKRFSRQGGRFGSPFRLHPPIQ